MLLPLRNSSKQIRNSLIFKLKENKYINIISNLLNKRINIYNRFQLRLWIIFVFIIILIIKLSIDFISSPISIKYLISKENKTLKDFYTDNNLLKKYPISNRPIISEKDQVFEYGCRDPFIEANANPRENAAFVVLARNSEIDGVISSMKSLERHFNQWFNYPWIFLNNERFTKEFKDRVSEISTGPVKFGYIMRKRWNFNSDEENSLYFTEAIDSQGDRGIMYGNMESYHKMCRFYSGYFFNHPLVKKLDWYWRVEPDVEFYCDLTYDPFLEMKKNNKKYGFNIAIKELFDTVPNLFRYTKSFIKTKKIKLNDSWEFFINNFKFFKGENENYYKGCENKDQFFKRLIDYTPINRINKLQDQLINGENLIDKIDENSLKTLIEMNKDGKGLNKLNKDSFNNEEYNLCHFWSNFEIASTKLFQSEEYVEYFKYLEESQGFFAERWGDAPIHSLAVGMFLNFSDIHYFRDIGYKHSTLGHCPQNNFNNQLEYKSSSNLKIDKYSKEELDYWFKYDKTYKNSKDHKFKNKLILNNLVDDDYINSNKDDDGKLNTQSSPSSSVYKSMKELFDNDDKLAVGCRCRCPDDHVEIENSGGSCINLWSYLTNDYKDEDVYGNGSLLDLDRIEIEALKLYEDYLIKHGNDGSKWTLSEKDKRYLSSFIIDNRFAKELEDIDNELNELNESNE
ncbi:hypothetical protein BVG19_g5713 [[Candida] boidinii]|nr:hypothetical protein BVG19_g5713 [[Candida] boidinii]OWB49364.1 transferase activity protein [[Candida] boidinii]